MIQSMDGLITAMPGQRRPFNKASQTTEGAGTWHSLLKAAGQPGAAATPASGNGVIPDNSSAGMLRFANPGGGIFTYLARFQAFGGTVGTVILYDRLWHNSGLSGTSVAAQAFTQPALTRPDALGEDVELWGEVYTAMGATGSVFTATYVDQDGNAGNSAVYTMPANALSVGQMFPFALAAGDTGVRSVSQVILSISTGTAGDFGLVLLRRIAEVPIVVAGSGVQRDIFRLGMPRVYDSAALALMVFCSTTNSGVIMGSAGLVQG